MSNVLSWQLSSFSAEILFTVLTETAEILNVHILFGDKS